LTVPRFWSLTASTVPVTVGAALAAHDGHFNGPLLALCLLSGWLLQISANLLNTYGDFRSGVDTSANPPTAPHLVNGTLRPCQVLGAGVFCLLAGALAGALAAARSDWRLAGFAAAGVAGAACYTTGPRFKYAGFGLPAVALLMGVLMVTASYFAQTRTLTLPSLIVSLPVACLVGAILHGNDLRDMVSDRRAGIRTVSLVLGSERAPRLFMALHILPHLILAAGIAAGLLPPRAGIALLTLPFTVGALRTCAAGFHACDPARISRLEGLSAGLHFFFGTLLTLGLFFG
jgi:1,4-dihydroxy-2-naphthoate octaprenyltransferase